MKGDGPCFHGSKKSKPIADGYGSLQDARATAGMGLLMSLLIRKRIGR